MSARRKREYPYSRYSELDRERHGIAGGMPTAPERTTEASELISGLLGQWGLKEQAWLQALEEEWVALIGKQVARHVRPGRMDRGVLYVFVSNSVWLSELKRHGESAMLEKLQARFGADKITSLQMRLDPDFGEGA